MSCPEKETLQRRSMESWNALESAFNDLGVALDPKIGEVMPRLMKGLSGLQGLIDSRSGTSRSPSLDAFSLLLEHRKASSLLDNHLHTHRC